MPVDCQVAIVGAGPYGLSLAAHLRARGIDHRIVGLPMHNWRTRMPRRMRLKSEGFASSLDAPNDAYPLRAYCADQGVAYADIGVPVRIETFVDYGMAFQQRFVPHLEATEVAHVEHGYNFYTLRLASGERFTARCVVVAVGISSFGFVPDALHPLSEAVLSHASAHADLGQFAGQSVLVVGGGASAIDVATLLAAGGAETFLTCRKSRLDFHEPPRPQSLYERLRYPRSGLGLGWKSKLVEDFPHLLHRLPAATREHIVTTHLGPAAGWFVREPFEQGVTAITGSQILSAREQNGRAVVHLRTPAGTRTLTVHRVIAATGYKVDLRRLPFLCNPILGGVATEPGGAPRLSGHFETTAPGLYFVGPVAATSFGPLLRFACGSQYVAKRLVPHLASRLRRPLREPETSPPYGIVPEPLTAARQP